MKILVFCILIHNQNKTRLQHFVQGVHIHTRTATSTAKCSKLASTRAAKCGNANFRFQSVYKKGNGSVLYLSASCIKRHISHLSSFAGRASIG